ncbi:MAG: TetR/AcrR family transcriptional regulator [Tissierellia bacterium]|nr:TetR/AcrR family transcriptional regulator [Tissierellia bacterium]
MKKESIKLFHQERIIESADKLFLIKGKEETTVDEIAKEANYSKATIYVYFKSKDDIFNHVFLKYMKLLKSRIENGMSESIDAIKQYYSICEELHLFSEEYPDYYRLLTTSVQVDVKSKTNDEALEEIFSVGEEINGKVIEIISAGIVQGYFRVDIEILPMVFIYWSSITSIIEMSNNKNEYIYEQMNLDKKQFLHYSFSNLLKMILR